MRRICPRLVGASLCTGFLSLNQAAFAAVDIHIEEIKSGVLITALGTINLPNVPLGTTTCGRGQVTGVVFGAIDSSIGSVCVGDGSTLSNYYTLVQPSQAYFGDGPLVRADESTGSLFGIEGNLGFVGSNGGVINSSSTFFGKTLTDLGIRASGDLGVWTVSGTNDTISVRATDGFIPPVPGPLGTLVLPMAYGFTRQLRQKIKTASKRQLNSATRHKNKKSAL
jgi:hypothetical protein